MKKKQLFILGLSIKIIMILRKIYIDFVSLYYFILFNTLFIFLIIFSILQLTSKIQKISKNVIF